MAQFIISIPDAQLSRVLTGLGAFYGYQPFLQDPDGNPVPNPVSRATFIKGALMDYLKEGVLQGEAQLAFKAAHEATPPTVDVT